MKNERKRPGRRARRGAPRGATEHHTSVPTGRFAYTATRRWLLDQHGPVCAYCGLEVEESTITLDHVSPRRGLTAYDRRDNLVLCCRRCNAAKADKPFVAYILGQKIRAANLVRYGQHLSHGILDLVRHIAGELGDLSVSGQIVPRLKYGPASDDDSPYLDSPYLESA